MIRLTAAERRQHEDTKIIAALAAEVGADEGLAEFKAKHGPLATAIARRDWDGLNRALGVDFDDAGAAHASHLNQGATMAEAAWRDGPVVLAGQGRETADGIEQGTRAWLIAAVVIVTVALLIFAVIAPVVL